MEKTKIYDIKIKVQQEPNGSIQYKPSYVRFLVMSDNLQDAKKKALSVFTGDDIDKLKFTITKTSLMKVDGIFKVTNKN